MRLTTQSEGGSGRQEGGEGVPVFVFVGGRGDGGRSGCGRGGGSPSISYFAYNYLATPCQVNKETCICAVAT